MKNILIILPLIGDTKDSKRIDQLINAGFCVKAVAFQRDYPIMRAPKCDVVLLSKIEHGHYFVRLISMLFSAIKMRKHLKECDLVYAMSPDLAFFAYFSGFALHKPLIMDVADIRHIQVRKSIVGFLWRIIDKFISSRCTLVVVTARGYLDRYYSEYLGVKLRDTLVIENKVDYTSEIKTASEVVVSENTDRMVIGYFGVLRSTWTIELLRLLITRYPTKFEILLAGVDFQKEHDLIKLSSDIDGFNYIGAYKSPEQLPSLYKKVDLVIACYPDPTNDINWHVVQKISRSNRFYEALFFNKPLITMKDSEDGAVVDANNIGLGLLNYEYESALSSISAISTDDLCRWKKNISKIPDDIFTSHKTISEIRSKLGGLILLNESNGSNF